MRATTKVQYKDVLKFFDSVEFRKLGSTPARVNRKSRALQLNEDTFPGLPDEHKLFVVLHELGHVELDTSDEKAVDKWASDIYTSLGHSLSASVTALTHLLNEDNPDHMERAELQLQRAQAYDYKVNGNRQAFTGGYIHPNNPLAKAQDDDEPCCAECAAAGNAGNALLNSIAHGVPLLEDFTEDFEGCQPGEKHRQCLKRIRVESKAVARENRSEGKRLKGESKATLAEQGIAPQSGMSKFKEGISAVGSAAKDALSGLKGGDSGGGGPAPPDNKTLWIAGGIGGVLIIGLILFLVLKK